MRIIKSAKKRTLKEDEQLRQTVAGIIENVVNIGDEALYAYNEHFDGCKRENLRVSKREIAEAYGRVDVEIIEKMKVAADNIRTFAEAQKDSISSLSGVEPVEGIELGHSVIPVDSVCCYVPGGNYALYSTALMLVIPAKTAGVKRVVACSPAVNGTDMIDPMTVVALDVAGVDEIYMIGGAQAVAAFSYGTEEIEPVSIIVGPGNSYVTEAKRQCYGQVGIDFVAGPSEVMIIADETADPAVAAADILAQSEHDKAAKAIMVTTDEKTAKQTIEEVEKQLATLETFDIASVSWIDQSEVLIADNLEEAASYANVVAPEHLEINVSEEKQEILIENLRNYGSLFIGQNTAEVFGDYASGTNHTLPTMGAARYTGGVWAGTFLKVCTYQRSDRRGMEKLIPIVSALAEGEGLEGHARAARIRKNKLCE